MAKLWLVAGDEIVARDYPYDDRTYFEEARGWYWGAVTPGADFMRPPGFPLWMAALSLTGAPLRLATELLLLGGALALVSALVMAGLPKALAAVAFAAVAFQPWAVVLLRYATPDTLFAAVLLYALALSLRLLVAPGARVGPLVLLGLLLGLLWHTRPEGPLLLVQLALVGVLGGALAWHRGSSALAASRVASRLIAVPALVLAVAVAAVNTVNYARFGVWAPTSTATPGFEMAMRSLLGVRPQRPLPHAPVPAEARRRIAAASPTFRRLEACIDGPAGWWARDPDPAKRPELNHTQLRWAIHYAARACAGSRTAADAERTFTRLGREIEAACAGGRLTCRQVVSSFLDPAFAGYRDGVAPTLAAVWSAFTTSKGVLRSTYDSTSAPTPEYSRLFAAIARRAPTAGPTPLRLALQARLWRVHGWMARALAYGSVLAVGLLSVAFACRVPPPPSAAPLGAAVLLLAGTTVIRAGFIVLVSVLDLTNFDPRYLLPVLPLYGISLLVVTWLGMRHAWTMVRSRRRTAHPP